MKKQSYPDLVINAFQSVQAWKSLALILIGILIAGAATILWMANNQKVLLIPQNFASTAKGPVTLNLGDPFSPDYLTSIAKGDVYALLNWTPESIDLQYGAFMARLSPAVHTAQKEVLLSEARQLQADQVTQSFYVTRSFVRGTEVILHGVLVRSTGGKEIFRGRAVYALDYLNAGNGYLQVNGVRQPTDEQLREEESPTTKKN